MCILVQLNGIFQPGERTRKFFNCHWVLGRELSVWTFCNKKIIDVFWLNEVICEKKFHLPHPIALQEPSKVFHKIF